MKLKMNSSVKKRVLKCTSKGKYVINHGYVRHNRFNRSSKARKQKVGTKIASKCESKCFKKMRAWSLG